MCRRQVCLISLVWVSGLVLTSGARASDSGLVGWWRFNETSGAVAHDSSGNGYDGAINGNPTWEAGYFDGALKLDGTGDYVQLNIGSLIPTLNECTFSIWVNWAGGGNWQRFIDIGTGTANYIYFVPADSGTVLRIAIVAGNGIWNEIITSDALPTGNWHNVALTVSESAATMILYLDGEVIPA